MKGNSDFIVRSNCQIIEFLLPNLHFLSFLLVENLNISTSNIKGHNLEKLIDA